MLFDFPIVNGVRKLIVRFCNGNSGTCLSSFHTSEVFTMKMARSEMSKWSTESMPLSCQILNKPIRGSSIAIWHFHPHALINLTQEYF